MKVDTIMIKTPYQCLISHVWIVPLCNFPNVHAAYSENGSVTKEIYFDWYKKVLIPCFPDAKDVPGWRVMIKSDGGPGRNNDDYLVAARADGVYHYPGLPNGTLFQELDQIFGKLKTEMDANRQMLWLKQYDMFQERARVGPAHIAFILFGGDVPCEDGTVLRLENAFVNSMDAAHLASATAKCGYIPANRKALESGKLRQELVFDEDGSLSEETHGDSTEALLLLQMERQNHAMADKLVAKGYTKAKNLKKYIKRVSAEQTRARNQLLTVPGTTARQRALLKANTAGDFFRVTNGGGIMNSDDCILAAELKEYEKERKILDKEKKDVYAFRVLKSAASKALRQRGPQANWTAPDFETMILLKDQKIPKKDLKGKEKKVNLWNRTYKNMAVPNLRWTRKKEKRLDDVKKGNLGSVDETGIWKRAIKNRMDFLNERISAIPSEEALCFAGNIFQKHFVTEEAAVEFVRNLYGSSDDGKAVSGEDSVSSSASYYSDDFSGIISSEDLTRMLADPPVTSTPESTSDTDEDSIIPAPSGLKLSGKKGGRKGGRRQRGRVLKRDSLLEASDFSEDESLSDESGEEPELLSELDDSDSDSDSDSELDDDDDIADGSDGGNDDCTKLGSNVGDNDSRELGIIDGFEVGNDDGTVSEEEGGMEEDGHTEDDGFIEYETLTEEELMKVCKKRGMKVDRRSTKKSMIARLKAKEEEEEEEKRRQEEEAEKAEKAARNLLRPLTEDEMVIVRDAMYGDGPEADQIASTGTDSVQRSSMRKLRPGEWLNDEVIHFFYKMLAKRDKSLCANAVGQKRRRCHYFKSFFFTKLFDEGDTNKYRYASVERWSEEVPGKDIFELDKIFFACNIRSTHWTCAVIFMQKKRIQFYDSMGKDGQHYCKGLMQYLKDEWKAKKGGKLPNEDQWEIVTAYANILS